MAEQNVVCNNEGINDFKPLPPDKKFHVFLSYRDIDEDNKWVCELIKILERDHKLKCCNHVYDFQPGMTIVENIKNAVLNSVKTLIIMSKHYKDSYWCKFEVEFSHKFSMDIKQNLIIPVLKETCEIPDHLHAFTYIDGRGAMEEWIPRLVAAIEEQGVWSSSSSFLVPGSSVGHQNLDILHEEKSKLSCCCRKIPFKTRTAIPYALNNQDIMLSDETFFKSLKNISKAVYFRYRHCIFPWIPIVCVALLLFGTNSIVIIFYFLSCTSNHVSETTTDRNTCRITLGVPVCTFACMIIWLTSCIVCCKQRKKLFAKHFKNANRKLMESKLLAGYRIYYTSATIGVVYVYFDANYCKEYIKKILKKRENASVSINLHTTTESTGNRSVNKEDSMENEKLIRSEELIDQEYEHTDCFDLQAWELLAQLSVDYTQEFLDERLGTGERFRHTPRAICMCQYAQLKNLIPEIL